MSETQKFETAVEAYCDYLKNEKGFTLRQIENCVRNIGSMVVEEWNAKGGE